MTGNTVRLQAITDVEAYVPPAVSFSDTEAPGEIFGKIPPEDLAKMRTATPEEREAMLRKAGATDEMIKQMNEMRSAKACSVSGERWSTSER